MRILEGRPCYRLQSRLPKIVHCLFAHLAAKSMMGELLDKFVQPVGIDPLNDVDNLLVQRLTVSGEKASIGDIMGERVLEGIRDVRKEARVVHKFGFAQLAKSTSQLILVQSSN